MIVTVFPMAMRWQWLLAAQRIVDRLRWLSRAYFVSYTAGQILPTSIGGDAVRIFETSRRHPGRTGDITAIVLLERGLGGAATVLLGAVGFVLAIGHYDVGAYLWLEGAFVFGTLAAARPLLLPVGAAAARPRATAAHAAPGRAARCARSTTASTTTAATPGCCRRVRVHDRVQAVRILSIWASCGRSGSSSSRGSTT